MGLLSLRHGEFISSSQSLTVQEACPDDAAKECMASIS